MTVVVWAPHRDASTFYRLTEPARVLGVRVVESVDSVGDADTVVTNRPILSWHRAVVEMWVGEGRRVIVDMDDDFDALPRGHKLYGRFPTTHLHATCEAASTVTCATPALVDRYGHGKGVLLRNGIPESYLGIRRAGRRVPNPWVGWYASLASHPNDVPVLGDAIAKTFAEVDDAEFVYVGPESDRAPLADALGVDPVMLGFFSMQGLMQVVAEFDVGVVPLDLSPFNQAKSWLKGLEMAAVGVPVVASPTPEYVEMNRAGGCEVAYDIERWADWLSWWLRDPDWRRAQAKAGRTFAAAQTYEARADEWRAVWLQ